MIHAPSAVTPLDPERIEVGDAIGQRAQRRGLVQGAVRPVGAAEVLVLAQHGHQVHKHTGDRRANRD
jgi:hypothetical protein